MNTYIDKLVSYAIKKNLIEMEDATYCTNRVLALLQCDDYSPTGETFTENDTLEDFHSNYFQMKFMFTFKTFFLLHSYIY